MDNYEKTKNIWTQELYFKWYLNNYVMTPTETRSEKLGDSRNRMTDSYSFKYDAISIMSSQIFFFVELI